MRFVHNHMAIAPGEVLLHALDNVVQRGQVPVHAVQRLHRHKDMPPTLADLCTVPTLLQESSKRLVQGRGHHGL